MVVDQLIEWFGSLLSWGPDSPLIFLTAVLIAGIPIFLLMAINALVSVYAELKISAFMFPAFPFFFINNATFQGLKKPLIVMFMAILRFVLIPIIILSLIIFLIDKNFVYIFIALVFMHWFIAIFYFIFSKYKIASILYKAIEFPED